METYRADLHLHTVLSACAEVEMIPPLIIDTVKSKGLNIIAITDHNTSGNAEVVMEAAAGSGIYVFPGMELQVREEVDILCIFDTSEQVRKWQQVVDGRLLPLENDPDHFGRQFLVDAEGDYIAEDMRLLQAPTTIGLEEAARFIHELDGLVIPAHIDRANGLMTVLGLWPADFMADAVEVSHTMHPAQASQRYILPPKMPIISNSDAHWLDWIGKVSTIFELNGPPSVAALRRALRQEQGCRAYVL